MGVSSAPAKAWGRMPPTSDWLRTLLGTLAIIAIGVLLGTQYVTPDKRVIAVSAAVIVAGVAWRLDTVTGIGLLLLLLPFPRGTVFGNTNMAIIMLLLVIWLLRFSTGVVPKPRHTPLDAPLIALFVAYVVSFYNVEPRFFLFAFNNFVLFISTVAMFYLIANNVRTTAHLKRLHMFMVIAALLVLLVSLFELLFPGRALVPGWISFGTIASEGTEVHDRRIGGPFFDFELLSDFCALLLPMLGFLFGRARSVTQRVFLGGMMLFALFILFTTVTRGALIALGTGLVALLFMVRRRVQIVPLTLLVALGTATVLGISFGVSHYTSSGDVFERMAETTFVNGLPDSRAAAWPMAIERWMHHPLIGWGPHYTAEHGLEQWYWPHNLILYVANCVGAIGLACFLWLLWKLFRLTHSSTDDLQSPSYAASYLIIARAQFIVFFVDQLKIEYLRSPYYQFQIWVMFSSWVAAAMIHQREQAARLTRPAA